MKGNPRIIESLNKVLELEIGAILQYLKKTGKKLP
jgi:bacterioferritin (cytochrome b1)